MGLLDNSVIFNSSFSVCGVVTWRAIQFLTTYSVISSISGNQILLLNEFLVFVIPRWPSWAMLKILSWSVFGTTILSLLNTKPSSTVSSGNTNLNGSNVGSLVSLWPTYMLMIVCIISLSAMCFLYFLYSDGWVDFWISEQIYIIFKFFL